GWLQRVAAFGWRLIATLLFVLVVAQAMILLSTVTVAIVIALIIAATFAPYVKRLRDRGWSRAKAAAGVSLLALGAVTLAIVILAIVFLPYVSDLISTVRAGGQQVGAWLASANLPRGISGLVGLVIEGVRGVFVSA